MVSWEIEINHQPSHLPSLKTLSDGKSHFVEMKIYWVDYLLIEIEIEIEKRWYISLKNQTNIHHISHHLPTISFLSLFQSQSQSLLHYLFAIIMSKLNNKRKMRNEMMRWQSTIISISPSHLPSHLPQATISSHLSHHLPSTIYHLKSLLQTFIQFSIWSNDIFEVTSIQNITP